MPKPAMPPRGQHERNLPLKNRGLPSFIMTTALAITAVGLGVIIGRGLLSIANEKPPQGLELGYHPKAEFIDFTGQLFYGKDESTGVCFAARYPKAKHGFTRVPCEALEKLKR